MKKITEQQQEIINSLMTEFNRMNKTVESKASFNFIDIEPLIDKTREIENNNAIIKADAEAWKKLAIEEADRLVVLFQKDLPNSYVRRMGKGTGHYEDSTIIICKDESGMSRGDTGVRFEVRINTETNQYLSHDMRFDKGKSLYYREYGSWSLKGDVRYSSVEELIQKTNIAEEIRRLIL